MNMKLKKNNNEIKKRKKNKKNLYTKLKQF